MPELEPVSTRFSISSVPMHEVEPSPVDETPPEDQEFPSDPSELDPEKHPSYFPPSRSTTNTLGTQRSRIPHILLAVQKYATIPPALYLAMHYTNTALIPITTLSLSKAENSLLLTRPYYQSFPLEPLLIFAPIAAHAISGITLRLWRRRQAAKRYGAETHAQRVKYAKNLWPQISLTSALGYILYPLMVGHVIVNRYTPLKIHGDSSSVGLRFFSYGMQRHPWISNLGYAFMISVASFHFVTGAAKYLKLSREYITEGGDYGDRQRKTRGRLVNLVGALVAGIWMAGGLGVVGRGIGAAAASAWEAKQWDEVYRSVPIFGEWM